MQQVVTAHLQVWMAPDVAGFGSSTCVLKVKALQDKNAASADQSGAGQTAGMHRKIEWKQIAVKMERLTPQQCKRMYYNPTDRISGRILRDQEMTRLRSRSRCCLRVYPPNVRQLWALTESRRQTVDDPKPR